MAGVGGSIMIALPQAARQVGRRRRALRAAVGAGIWRTNHQAISGWAVDPDGDSNASVISIFHA
jgi:hypothetical protein